MFLLPAIFTIELISLLIGVILLVPALWMFSNRKHEGSSVFTFFFLLAFGVWFLGWDNTKSLFTLSHLGSLFTWAGLVLAAYSAIGFATGFVYWFSYAFNAKEEYELALSRGFDSQFIQRLLKQLKLTNETDINSDLKAAAIKWCKVKDNLRSIFDDPARELNIPIDVNLDNLVNGQEGVALYSDAIKNVLPPRFAVCKTFIVWAAIEWPVTLLWLIYDRLLRQIVDMIFTMCRGTFDAISRRVWAEIQF